MSEITPSTSSVSCKEEWEETPITDADPEPQVTWEQPSEESQSDSINSQIHTPPPRMKREPSMEEATVAMRNQEERRLQKHMELQTALISQFMAMQERMAQENNQRMFALMEKLLSREPWASPPPPPTPRPPPPSRGRPAGSDGSSGAQPGPPAHSHPDPRAPAASGAAHLSSEASPSTSYRYERGRRKPKEAETQSDLQSDLEAPGQRPPRRKRKCVRLGAPRLLELSSMDSEEDCSPPPKKNLPPAPTTNLPATPPESHGSLFTEMLQSWEPDINIDPSLPGSQSIMLAPQQSSEPALLKEVLTKLELVFDQQKTILQMLQRREAQVPATDIEECLPLQDLHQLLSLEQRMQQSAEYKQKMVNQLCVIGGADVRDCTWRILKKLFTNTLAMKLNWRGVNGKTSLATLQLREVVIAAVWRNPLTVSATDTAVEATMKRWLQLAADREGGRKRRRLLKENV